MGSIKLLVETAFIFSSGLSYWPDFSPLFYYFGCPCDTQQSPVLDPPKNGTSPGRGKSAGLETG